MEPETVFEWPPLESNPDIFSEYLHSVGLPNEWTVLECFGLDDECLSFVNKPTLAVIANIERTKKEDDKAKGDASVEANFYMK